MAIFKGSIRSQVLTMDTGLCVILPFDNTPVTETDCPVLYLLHGHSNNADVWTRMTSLERYVLEYGIAVVMPEVQRSFYTDMRLGMEYYQYVAKELPVLCRKMFHLSDRRQDNFVAGLSMGGYGALKIALREPGSYAGAASFSGCLDIAELRKMVDQPEMGPTQLGEAKAIFGEDLAVLPEDDLFCLVQQVAALPEKDRPKLMITCGTEDFLYADNVRFVEKLHALSYPVCYEQWPGEHEWGFWDESVRRMLEHFFADRKKALFG